MKVTATRPVELDVKIMGMDENGMIEGWNPSLISRLFETEDD